MLVEYLSSNLGCIIILATSLVATAMARAAMITENRTFMSEELQRGAGAALGMDRLASAYQRTATFYS